MDTSKVIGIAVSFLGSLAGAGPWGLAAMALGLIASVVGVGYAIRGWNRKVDANDQKLAGADAGNTATELQNQTRDVARGLDEVGKANPADDPDKKPEEKKIVPKK